MSLRLLISTYLWEGNLFAEDRSTRSNRPLGSKSNCPKSALTWQTTEIENSSIGLYFLRHSSWLINSCSTYYCVLYAAEETSRSCLSLLCNCVSRYSVKKKGKRKKKEKV